MWRLRQWIKRLALNMHSAFGRARAKIVRRRWIAQANRVRSMADGKTLLHIGCGDIDAPGYINLDARPQPHVHIVTNNLFRLAMVPDGVADLVYMSHVLEHVSHRDVAATLSEMRRILKPGGVLRLSVPDFDKLTEIYFANNRDITSIEGALMGGQDYTFNFHHAAFNDQHIRRLLLRSGFREARSWDPDRCDHHDFDDWASKNIFWQDREFPVSLNVEGIK